MIENTLDINKKITAILRSTLEGFWIVNNKAEIIEVNDTYLKMIGYQRDEFHNIKIFDVEAVENPEETAKHIEIIIKNGSDIFETKHKCKDGTIIIVEISVSYVDQNGGEFFCFIKDITTIKRNEALLNARLKLSDISQFSDLDTLIRSALDVAESITESSIGFFHFVNEDQESLKLQTWSTNTLQHMCKAEGKGQHYPISMAGIWVDCISARKPVIHNDYATYEHKKGLPEGHAPIIRELTVPIMRNDKIIAIIGVGNKKNLYVQDDIEAVSILSSMTIDLIERKKLEVELKETNIELENRVKERTESLNDVNKELQNTLHKAQSLAELNQIIITTSPIGKIVYKISDGKCIVVNNTALKMLEVELQSFLAIDFTHVELWNQNDFKTELEIAIKTKTELKQIFSFYIKESIKWFDINLTFFTWDNESHILLCFEEITERKHIEEILQESEEKFRTLFENIMEGVALHEMVYDNTGKAIDYRILDVNPAYKDHTGLDRIIAKNKLATQLYNVDIPPYLEEYGTVAETGQPYRFETFFPPMEKFFNISVISPQKGKFATVFEDITESKNREKEIIQKNEELTRFIYTVSHDLKSPLITIKAFTSYLKEDLIKKDIEAQNKDIGYIQNATDKMGRLLDELLELSRVGRKEISRVEVHLENIVNEALDLVAGRISKANITVVTNCKNVLLYVDKQRIIQLFQNLIDNASKYIGEQENPVLEIGVLPTNETSKDIILFVKDNGSGIDTRFHHKVFGLFEKIDTSKEGTGIGLALVKRIVEVHNGKIWFESEGIGKGTTFYFTLEKTKLL